MVIACDQRVCDSACGCRNVSHPGVHPDVLSTPGGPPPGTETRRESGGDGMSTGPAPEPADIIAGGEPLPVAPGAVGPCAGAPSSPRETAACRTDWP